MKYHERIDMIGKTFDRWTVIKFSHTNYRGNALWNCVCICGIKRIVLGHSLRSGKSLSCGCLCREETSRSNKILKPKHRMGKTKFYRAWSGMLSRCTNIKVESYPRYGGRGIKVYDRWLKFENFKIDMYESYLEHILEFGAKNTSLDRINNDGNYELNNCKWSTNLEQTLNRSNMSHSNNYKEHKYFRSDFNTLIGHILSGETLTSKKAEYYLGCTIEHFKQYIASLFEPWMTWDNRGPYRKNSPKTWSLEHIEKVRTFDLSKESDRLKCCHYTNLKPYDSRLNNKNI